MTEQDKQQATIDQEKQQAAEPQAQDEQEHGAAAEADAAEGQAEASTEGDDAAVSQDDAKMEDADPVAELESKLEEQRRLADENYQRYLRAQADFENFRRRARQEKEEFTKYASAKLIEQLLPVVDNFERALAAAKDNKDYDALLKGVDMIYRQLEQALAAEGLTPIESVGKPFNPEFHQAIMQEESEEHEEGIVVEEMMKGYMLKEKVLRPAMVKVSK